MSQLLAFLILLGLMVLTLWLRRRLRLREEGEPPAVVITLPPQEEMGRVLVVTTDEMLRTFAARRLARHHLVTRLDNTNAAIAWARAEPLGLVIIALPGRRREALALCRALRGDPASDTVGIIVVIDTEERRDRVAALLAGADQVVLSPIDESEMELRVRNAVARHRRLQERLMQGAVSRSGSYRAGALRTSGSHRAPAPAQPPRSDPDALYLQRVRTAIEAHLGEEEFGVAELAHEVGQDRTHLFRRLRELLRQSPSDLIRQMRLERAERLLAEDGKTVAEVAFEVGFHSVAHFSKCFRDKYGVSPAAFSRRLTSKSSGIAEIHAERGVADLADRVVSAADVDLPATDRIGGSPQVPHSGRPEEVSPPS